MDIKIFCEYTYNFTYIPIYIYINHEFSTYIHAYSENIMPPKTVLIQMSDNSESISIYETTIGSYYGQIYLKSQNTSVILGPISPLKYTENRIRKFFYDYNISPEQHQTYQNFLLSTPSMSLISFVMLLYQMNYAITGTKSDLPPIELAPYHWDKSISSTNFAEHTKNNLETGYHNTLFEAMETTMPIIKNGDLEGLARYSKNQIPMNFGTYSNNLLKQQLVVFIISVTNAMNAAIQGGANQQAALSLAELYIQNGLHLSSPADVDALSMNAILEFTRLVKAEKLDRPTAHPSILTCIQYIRERVYTPISVTEIADFAGYSMEHFSRLFKKEVGFTAHEFIMNCKLYEAKKLLKFTNMTIGQISNQLYFSNQSHFQKLFKKKFHITPLQFRNSTEQV